MGWIILALSICFEVTGTVMMKLSKGFTVLAPSIAVFVCYGFSLAGLTLVLKYLEISIVYAIWAGGGTAIVAVIGIYFFNEGVTALKVVSLALVIAGVIGLQLSSKGA